MKSHAFAFVVSLGLIALGLHQGSALAQPGGGTQVYISIGGGIGEAIYGVKCGASSACPGYGTYGCSWSTGYYTLCNDTTAPPNWLCDYYLVACTGFVPVFLYPCQINRCSA